eukprot:NODE_4_length_77007_cov_1.156642.p43 type:complete len:256 gc:universal NODE_4_length_77007_cov_1.156642:74707-75474(+)
MQPIFHVEYSEPKPSDPSKKISYRHVYYSNKIETFVKYAFNWLPISLTKLVCNPKTIDCESCPKFTPNIDTKKDIEVLYLECINQHHSQNFEYKSKKWYEKFNSMYNQSKKYSIGQKRKIEIPFWEDDSIMSEKRQRYEDLEHTTLKEFESLEDSEKTITAADENDVINSNILSTPKKSIKPLIQNTPSKILATELESKLGSISSRTNPIVCLSENSIAKVCDTCHLSIEPSNQKICLSKIYDTVDAWMKAYYSE